MTATRAAREKFEKFVRGYLRVAWADKNERGLVLADEDTSKIMTAFDTFIEDVAQEVEGIIVDVTLEDMADVGKTELHTTIGGNAGTRRAAGIIRSHKSPRPGDGG